MKARLLGDDYHWPNTECVREYAHILVIRAVPVGERLFQFVSACTIVLLSFGDCQCPHVVCCTLLGWHYHSSFCYWGLAVVYVQIMLCVVLYWDVILMRHFVIEFWRLSMSTWLFCNTLLRWNSLASFCYWGLAIVYVHLILIVLLYRGWHSHASFCYCVLAIVYGDIMLFVIIYWDDMTFSCIALPLSWRLSMSTWCWLSYFTEMTCHPHASFCTELGHPIRYIFSHNYRVWKSWN